MCPMRSGQWVGRVGEGVALNILVSPAHVVVTSFHNQLILYVYNKNELVPNAESLVFTPGNYKISLELNYAISPELNYGTSE